MKWKIRQYLCLSLIAVLGLLYSCEKETITYSEGPVSYAKDIQNIFTKNCISCHNGTIRNPNLQAGASYNALIKGGYVNTSNPTQSILYKQVTTVHSFTTPTENQKILVWIKSGALNN